MTWRRSGSESRQVVSPRSWQRLPWAVVWMALLLALVPTSLVAQVGLSFDQKLTRYNLQSTNGVPISTDSTDPGSNGLMPPGSLSFGYESLQPTAKQFQGLISFGGVDGPIPQIGTFNNLTNGPVAIVLSRVQVGSPYISRAVSFSFGSVVPVPDTDENGVLLSMRGVDPEAYWLPRPYNEGGDNDLAYTETDGYYWSPHAGKVYAIQGGPIEITWVKRQSQTAVPPTDDLVLYWNNNGNYFRLNTVSYVVSASPTPGTPVRKMYWTEKGFSGLGVPLVISDGLVGDLRFIYNKAVPKTVTEQFRAPGDTSPTDGGTNSTLQELRTIWWDKTQKTVLAYNREGRIFMELLGDLRPNGLSRLPLGTEIVELQKYPFPTDVSTEMGELLRPPAPGTLAELVPKPLGQLLGGQTFVYERNVPGTEDLELYATRPTANLNDYLVHWLEEGVAGLRWPKSFGRYRLFWPTEAEKYSHYVRPLVDTKEEAEATAVTLAANNVPSLDYQDPLDKPRAFLTADYKFYTFLDADEPAHRTLLRFNSGENVAFERVFSWLGAKLTTGDFANNSIVTNLDGWNPTNQTFNWPDELTAPRLVSGAATVGQRINAPGDEVGGGNGEDYLAGHINLAAGTLYNADAYLDPLAVGFDAANLGAIIPVNAIPGENQLEVWWFRRNAALAGPNAGDNSLGFDTIYWPSVIGRYSIDWPIDSREIVLASNDGSGALSSLEASGNIYVQNDVTQPGFNPNEEHALMQGGQAYALRDDLNIILGGGYSSEPYVLLDYINTDGRPSTTPFLVLREKDNERFTNYLVEAGSILQPPMPLPLMDKPLAPKLIGAPPRSLNQEVYFRTVEMGAVFTNSEDQVQFELTTVEPHHFRPYFPALALQAPDYTTNHWFYVTGVDYASKQLSGWVYEMEPVSLQTYTNTQQPASSNRFRYAITSRQDLSIEDEVVVISPSAATSWTAVIKELSVSDYVELELDVDTSNTNIIEALETATALLLPIAPEDNDYKDWKLRTEPVPGSKDPADAGFTLQDRKGNLWVYRGPHVEGDTAYFPMQFYYKTLPDFYFPTLAFDAQPGVGTITPYLRSKDKTSGQYAGNPVYGNRTNPLASDNNAFEVQYRPVWPVSAPVLQMAETLTVPKRGLPAVRGQTSLQVLYQQSTINNPTNVTVRLHDPTRQKKFELGPFDGTTILGRIPDSVNTTGYRGKTYFPNLPPHLSERLFLDPDDSPNGTLTLSGEFVDDLVGDKYLLLNVLSPKETETLKALCLGDDPAYGRWSDAIDQLSTAMEHFVENPQKPGTYVPGEIRNPGPSDLAEVWNDDVAVDSYALTASGPGTGYVTLITGNGLAFTPAAEPVSVEIIRVDTNLYQGELKVILSSNPLAEKVTMQQVVDLAGLTDDYEFEWRIASPVDGAPPPVYQTAATNLLDQGGAWSHVPFPLASDLPGRLAGTDETRTAPVAVNLVAVSPIAFDSSRWDDGQLEFSVGSAATNLVVGNRVTVNGYLPSDANQLLEYQGTVSSVTPTTIRVLLDDGVLPLTPAANGLAEAGVDESQPASLLFRTVDIPVDNYSQLWISLDVDDFLGAQVYLDGEPVITVNRPADNTPIEAAPGYLNPLPTLYRLDPAILDRHSVHQLAVELFSSAAPGVSQTFDLKIEALTAVDLTASGNEWLALDANKYEDGIRAIIGEGADVRALSDNYLIMRYQATNATHASYDPAGGWSRWTTPALAEGWIKRVLAGINPFNQRITDLFNNRVNTDVSILTQAGRRYEGDVALNIDAINDYGLIEIYETVLRRGRLISIDSGINFGPANDALLLAAGYLNDLYLLVGNEAWADAANPTIGIGTADNTYGEIATALFAFKGQVPTLLEEELALLRGRDDFLQPGVEVAPFYNRMVWNYTRGIDAGEVIYALNYNILENPDADPDGVINAEDAARMFPQGHGDAYGHYVTALKGYYSLLMNPNFDWVPRIEAVNVLGKPVAVDYQDERKFASAAAALARAGRQVFDLTWRKDYRPVHKEGWEHMAPTRQNSSTRAPGLITERHWGMDPWASRTGQGAYLNWVVGNSMLPETDPNPDHEGIQKVDRTTVPELKELASLAADLQTALDNAEGGLSPLGLPEDSIALDIDPNVVGADSETHFEQIYSRAKVALNNAVVAFDDAKDVTRLMRSEQDSLADLQNRVVEQELAYRNALIELYGTPYPDDMGPGKTWKQDYVGPDILHYMYVETPEITFPGMWNYPGDITGSYTYKIDVSDLPSNWGSDPTNYTDFEDKAWDYDDSNKGDDYSEDLYIKFELGPHGFFEKPEEWNGSRKSPGKIQEAISARIAAHTRLSQSLWDQLAAKATLDRNISLFKEEVDTYDKVHAFELDIELAEEAAQDVTLAYELYEKFHNSTKELVIAAADASQKSLPESAIFGTASGGDLSFAGRQALALSGLTLRKSFDAKAFLLFAATKTIEAAAKSTKRWIEFIDIKDLNRDQALRAAMVDIGTQFEEMQELLWGINLRLREYDDAQRNYQARLGEADRILEEREIFRKRAAALVQGYRTRDAAFRIFRNEKLERYKTLFDLAARYALLAANAYDYETGLLDTSAGRDFISRIINSRALGVVQDGEPQFAGSNTGDPGLSSALAEMKADWDVVKSRLGFNNPDAYGTTVSLRTELFRILPDDRGSNNWMQVLQQSRHRDLLEDADVRRYAMQISNGDGLPVPGLIVDFSTTIADGYNLFGQQLAAGDHAFSPSSFATKIFAAGVAMIGYQGMDDPAANGGAVTGSGGTSPSDPDLSYLDPLGLSATPYVYLIPVGVDSMRSPPLGDTSTIRSWAVNDVAIPMPFNIGASDFSTEPLYQSNDSLTEPLFTVRKHQSFRPVSSDTFFSRDLYGEAGNLMPSQYTNNRLVGRSVWNSRWKLIIPGKTLLNDPNEGLERFLHTVRDIKLHFVTYSYSGN